MRCVSAATLQIFTTRGEFLWTVGVRWRSESSRGGQGQATGHEGKQGSACALVLVGGRNRLQMYRYGGDDGLPCTAAEALGTRRPT